MLEMKKNGIAVVNTGMSDVALDETLATMKFENGKYAASSKELPEMPATFRMMATDFVPTDGVTWLQKENDKGEKEVAYMIIWDNEKNPIKVVQKTLKNKREFYKEVPVDTFKKQMGLGEGINRTLLSVIAKEMLKTAFRENGKIAYRGINKELIQKAGKDKVIEVTQEGVKNVVINSKTKTQVQELMQAIYSTLEPAEELAFIEMLDTRFKKDDIKEQVEIIKQELKSKTFKEFDIGEYVGFTPATFSALEKDLSKLDDGNFKENVEYIKTALAGQELAEMFPKTHIGGYVAGVVPALNNEVAVFDMRMLPISSAFDKNENFSKDSQMMVARRELKKLLNDAKENKSKIPAIIEKYEEIFTEIMPEFADKATVERYSKELASNPQKATEWNFFKTVTDNAILAEKTHLQGSYRDLYTMATAKRSERPIFVNNGLPYDIAAQLQNSNDFSVVMTANAHQNIKKRDMGEGVDIIATTEYAISNIQTKHQFVAINKKKTIPETIGYMVQDMLKMNNSGSFDYTVMKDGEQVTKTKVVDVAKNVEKMIKVIDENIELKTNKGILAALEELKNGLANALASGNVIEEVKVVLENKDALYYPIIEASSMVNTLSVSKTANRGYIANIYKESINADMPKISDIMENGNYEDIEYFQFTPKTASKDEKKRHYQVMSGIEMSIISNIEFANKTKNDITAKVATSSEFKEYLERCKANGREPTQNLIGFEPKVHEAKMTMAALKNRIDGRISTFPVNRVPVADSLFLKDGKSIVGGVEYDAKFVRSFTEINKNIADAKNDFIKGINPEESVVPKIAAILKEKADAKRDNMLETFNAIMGNEEAPKQEEQKTEAPQESAPVAETPQTEVAQTEQEVKEEAMKEIVPEPIVEDGASETVVVEDEADIATEAEMAFGDDYDSEISSMLNGDDEEEIDLFSMAEDENIDEEADIAFSPN